MHGVRELRVKESDRIAAMAAGLQACGATVEAGEDWMAVEGMGTRGLPGGVTCTTHLDHRIAMSFLCAGLAARQPVTIDDAGPIATSFPVFDSLMEGLGATFARAAR
jgi:3-phosphoshikimate 1-carboxyvinyltransferase